MIGQTISHYKILEKLGEGGMGVVYKAEDTKLKRIVALKFLPPLFSTDDEVKQRFIHEAQAASALNHTNICSIHTIEELEKQQFIDMELVEGKTLSVLLKGKEFSLKEVVDIALQVAEGVNAAHKKGIVHRDIKPDNIMITDENLVKIMDFGLAKLKGSSKLTKTHSTLGTLSYMSPEQAQGVEVDQRSDIFSFGVVLYEMITGRRPFKGEHEAAIIYSLINEAPEPLARYRANVPDELQRIVDKTLAKDREERYQHADELLADLRTERKKLEYTKAGYVTQAAGTPSARRLKRGFVMSAIIGGTLIVLFVLYLFFHPFERREPGKTGTGASEKSIAVLPFNNMSENKEDEYFSDGITEDIITDLAKIQGLRIIARNSAFQFKGENVDVKRVGEQLKVRYVMEGSVQRSINRLRINAQLIDAVSGFHVWTDRYDRDLKDVFAVQDEITGHIVSALTVTLSGAERQAMSSSRTSNLAAHDLFLQGRFYLYQFSEEEGPKRALEYFQKAIQEDPLYAEPYAGIAFTYIGLADGYMPPHEAYPRAISAARKALEIDSMSGDAHSALGSALTDYQWDFAEGAKEMRRALELSPNSFDVNTFAAIYSTIRGNPVEAIAYADHAITLDPLSAAASWIKEWCLYLARRYDDVIAQHKRVAELDSNFFYMDDYLGAAYREKGMLKEALQEYLKMQKLHPDLPLFGLAITYARMGNIAEAKRILNALEEISKKRYIATDEIAMICVNIGETERAFEYLDKAIQARSGLIPMLKIYSEYDPVRSDPRFQAVLKRVGLE